MKLCPACDTCKPLDAFRMEKGKPQSYCRDCHKVYMRVYYERNKERLTRSNADRLARKDPALKAAYLKAYHEKHRDRENARSAQWRRENPEQRAHLQRAHRARKRSAPGSHTKEDVAKLFALQRGMCPVCRAPLPEQPHVDHRVALSRGGSNDPGNLQLLCPPCNVSKHAKDPIAFMQERGFLL